MEWIDRYVFEVGSHLPEKQRVDIETELRSTLEDMLEDRSRELGRPVDDEMAFDLLRGYGRPEKVASSYLPQRYLVGPRLYPVFWMVLRIVLAVLLGLAVVGLGFDISRGGLSGLGFLKELGKSALGFVTSAIQTTGLVLVIFAIIERLAPMDEEDTEKWDPRGLQPRADSDRISISSNATEIGFTVLALVLFNLAPQWIKFAYLVDGSWSFVPLLSETFYRYLPWLNVLWIAGIVFSAGMLIRRRWELWSRWTSIALSAASVALMAVMVFGPGLVEIGPGFEAGREALSSLANLGVRIFLGVFIVLEVVEMFGKVRHLVRRKALPVVAS